MFRFTRAITTGEPMKVTRYRTLLDIDYVDDRYAFCVVPAWESKLRVYIPIEQLPDWVRDNPQQRFWHVMCNLNALTRDDLQIGDWEHDEIRQPLVYPNRLEVGARVRALKPTFYSNIKYPIDHRDDYVVVPIGALGTIKSMTGDENRQWWWINYDCFTEMPIGMMSYEFQVVEVEQGVS